MEGLKNLDSLYEHLEENALDYPYPHQIGSLFREVRDALYEENNGTEHDIQRAQWEIDFFHFKREEGKTAHWLENPDEQGHIIKYPDFENFSQDTYDYLVKRLESTGNILLQSCYAHILWDSPLKHHKYVTIAIDAYRKIVETYRTKEEETPGSDYCGEILDAIINAYCLAVQINHDVDAIKQNLKDLIQQKISDSRQAFVLRSRLIQWLLKGQKKFSKHDFDGLQHACWKMATSSAQNNELYDAITILALGERIEFKLEQATYNWRENIAKHYEALTEQRKEEPSVALLFCQKAIQTYKHIRNEQKIRELQQKFSQLKETITLKGEKFSVDLADHIKLCQKIAKEIAQQSPEDIIKRLILDQSLLPGYDQVEAIAEKHDQEFIADKICPPIILDSNGNIAQHISGEEERKYYQILWHYKYALDLDKIHLIHEIFLATIQAQKLSADVLLSFLAQCTWLGERFTKRYPNNQTIEYTWVSLIAPAVHEFFLQMQYFTLSPGSRPNFVLSIDSLALKLEGIIRQLYCLSGGSISYTMQDKAGNNVSREKDINWILHEDEIIQLFTKDDLLFFKFLLIEQAGYNLRNRVAHSLMLFQEYTIESMYLLIMALLKLAKYSDVSNGENQEGL